MKLTYEEIIMRVLGESNDWTPSFNLIKTNTKWGWLGTSADREARRLAENNQIERKKRWKIYLLQTNSRTIILIIIYENRKTNNIRIL